MNCFFFLFLTCFRFQFGSSHRYQSGFTPPGDIKFEDLSKMDPSESASPSEINSKIFNHHTFKNTLSAGKIKKRPGFFWIFKDKVRVCNCDANFKFTFFLLLLRQTLRNNFFRFLFLVCSLARFAHRIIY